MANPCLNATARNLRDPPAEPATVVAVPSGQGARLRRPRCRCSCSPSSSSRCCSSARCRRATGRCWTATRASTSRTTTPTSPTTRCSGRRSASPSSTPVIVIVALLGLALVMALLVQERRRGVGLLPHRLLPAGRPRARLARRCCSRASTARRSARSTRILRGARPHRRTGLAGSGTPELALCSTVVLIVWKFAGFFMLILLVGLQAIPTRSTRRPAWTARAGGRLFRVTLPLMRPSLALS